MFHGITSDDHARFAPTASHDGEDSDNWEAFYYPIADARKALDAVAALIEGLEPSGAEKWGEGLLQ